MLASFPDIQVGQTLDAGRLELVKLLGAGSHGVVYRARDTTSPFACPVFYAVKCLGDASPQIDNEVAYHTACSGHPSVVTLHRPFVEDGVAFAVLDAMDGNLWTHIDRGVYRFGEAALKTVFLQILDGVQAIHAQGIAHRDLKPENILCSSDGLAAKICDFGLAVDNEVPAWNVGGTQAYIPPEALSPEWTPTTFDHTAGDLWALAIVLLNMIGGCCPWDEAAPHDPAWASFCADPAVLKTRFPISDALHAVLLRMLHPDPAQRPALAALRVEIAAMDRMMRTEGLVNTAAIAAFGFVGSLVNCAKGLVWGHAAGGWEPAPAYVVAASSRVSHASSVSSTKAECCASMFRFGPSDESLGHADSLFDVQSVVESDSVATSGTDSLVSSSTADSVQSWFSAMSTPDSEQDTALARKEFDDDHHHHYDDDDDKVYGHSMLAFSAQRYVMRPDPFGKMLLLPVAPPVPVALDDCSGLRPPPARAFLRRPKLASMLTSVSEKNTRSMRRLRHWLRRTQSA